MYLSLCTYEAVRWNIATVSWKSPLCGLFAAPEMIPDWSRVLDLTRKKSKDGAATLSSTAMMMIGALGTAYGLSCDNYWCTLTACSSTVCTEDAVHAAWECPGVGFEENEIMAFRLFYWFLGIGLIASKHPCS